MYPRIISAVRHTILNFIDQLLPKHHPLPEIDLLYRMMRDYPDRGGKHIRGLLVLFTAQAFHADAEHALPLAAGVELFQNWVLIHDDIEDDSEERRGSPALHRLHGMPLALNAGDALHVYMWQAVFMGPAQARDEFVHMIHRTAEGQHMDLSWVEHARWDIAEQDYLHMVQLKTAYYTVISPLRLGMLAAGYQPDPRCIELGLALGAAFQIRDDVLNLVAEGDAYGKELAGDLWEGKRTLMLLHWLEHASSEQREFFLQAMNKPRSQKDPAEIARIHQWLVESGAVDYAMEVANREAERGLALLQAVLADAPNQEMAQHILHLLQSLATRQH